MSGDWRVRAGASQRNALGDGSPIAPLDRVLAKARDGVKAALDAAATRLHIRRMTGSFPILIGIIIG